MYKIGLIGAGQLGSRHLQSLAALELECEIQVVDPSPQSIQTAKERLAQVGKSPRVGAIDFYQDPGDLAVPLDLAIVACTADVRLEVLRKLTIGVGARNYVLDKVVFQSGSEFDEATGLLARTGSRCWINCQRRMMSFYRELKNGIQDLGPISYRVSGGNWGLGCNSIHFIDHLAWLVGSSDYTIDISKLDSNIHQSKRPGFVEFTGRLQGRFSDGSEFIFDAEDSQAPDFLINIKAKDLAIHIDEAKGEMVLQRDGSQPDRREFSFPYQSELTRLIAESVLERAQCPLTGFEESKSLHLPLLEGLTTHLEKCLSRRYDRCPIT